jgi:hypothetical protein
MKAKSIIYSRLISKGNYENAKIEIELEVEKGEKAADVYEAAKSWVEKRIAAEKLSDYTVEKAKKVMDDKRNHTLAQIEEAEEILSKVKVHCKSIRIFEWVNQGGNIGHPNILTEDWFDALFDDKWNRLIWNRGFHRYTGGTATDEYISIVAELK